MMQRHAIPFTSKAARAIVVIWDDHQVNENGEAMVGVVKRLWSIEYSYIENPEEYSNPWQMEARKRQLTNLFRHGEQCLGAWQRQAVKLSKPKTVDKRQVRLSKHEVSR
jgi:hypothetical protein